MIKLKRLFQIKTKLEVFLITYALGMGACERGFIYMDQYPGKLGWVFFALCTGSVFLASAKMLEAVELSRMYGID